MSLSDVKFLYDFHVSFLSVLVELSIESQALEQLRFKFFDELIIRYDYFNNLSEHSEALDCILGEKCSQLVFRFQRKSFRVLDYLFTLFAP